MILAELVLRDYKQFAGEHTIEFENQGIIAVIGPNGAGKTTLFEAIEWCLYGPRSIPNGEVFPRGREGKPLVRVTLENPETRQTFVVERRLRGKTMQAEVWNKDQSDQIIATGSAPVRAFVAEQLVGLGHDAFVSTFFTRQKELSFFGSLRPTERRTMVGRLIGVETVRLAQESIGLERSQAASRADGLAAQVEHERHDRDIDAEITAADEQVETSNRLLAERDADHATAKHRLEKTTSEAERIRLREQQDRVFADQITTIDAARGRLNAELESIERELTRLGAERERRSTLAPIADDQPARLATVEQWKAELQRHERVQQLRLRQAELERDQNRASSAAATLVKQSETPFVESWQWHADRPPFEQIAALQDVVQNIDANGARAEAQLLERYLARSGDLERSKEELGKYHRRLEALHREERELRAPGDPAIAITRIEREITEHRTHEARMGTESEQANANADRLTPLLQSLRNRDYGDHCPTCGRDIAPGDADLVITTLAEQVASWMEIATKRELDRNKARADIEQASAQLRAEHERQQRISTVRTRLEQGQQLTEEKTEEVQRLEGDVATILVQIGRTAAPGKRELAAAIDRSNALGKIIEAAQGLAQRQAQLIALSETERALAEQIAAMGAPAYDAAAHSAADAALEEANNAANTILQIDRDLARIPALATESDQRVGELSRTASERDTIVNERSRLAFDSNEPTAAREAMATATGAERQAMTALHLAQTAVRERRSELKTLTAHRDRLAHLFERSLAIRREADELDRMYREFAVFDQFVAARIAPKLAEQTSELLDLATDGKYNHVDFDENYGIQVYDGLDEKFALEGFSGGERDVVSLCARLALSQVIGSSAPNPPSFLVLDEVFGALDRERRVQLLELLGRISETVTSFQQMFIISHVDDVRSSPIFTRVLRIIETDDGSSRIEDATRGMTGED